MLVDAALQPIEQAGQNENRYNIDNARGNQRFINAIGFFLNLPGGSHDVPHGDERGKRRCFLEKNGFTAHGRQANLNGARQRDAPQNLSARHAIGLCSFNLAARHG